MFEVNKDTLYRASYSGGKDSSAMVIRLLEENYPLDSVDFLDTTYEYPELYEYVDKFEKYIDKNFGMKINRLYLPDKWEWDMWFYGKYQKGRFEGQRRGFPHVSGRHCYMSRQKGRVLDRYDRKAVRYIGIGLNEAHRVTDNPHLRYPLVDWGMTEDDCVEFLRERDILPTYNQYYKRTGCWHCPWSKLGSLKSLYIRHPDLWEKLKQYEKDSPHGYRTDYTVEELEEKFDREIEEEKQNQEKETK